MIWRLAGLSPQRKRPMLSMFFALEVSLAWVYFFPCQTQPSVCQQQVVHNPRDSSHLAEENPFQFCFHFLQPLTSIKEGPIYEFTVKFNAAVNGKLELTLLKGRQRFDTVSTSNLEV